MFKTSLDHNENFVVVYSGAIVYIEFLFLSKAFGSMLLSIYMCMKYKQLATFGVLNIVIHISGAGIAIA